MDTITYYVFLDGEEYEDAPPSWKNDDYYVIDAESCEQCGYRLNSLDCLHEHERSTAGAFIAY